ncbi:uncharacterized protein LOC123546718 isoform X2 [Mercenaria mercenaria]|uniref:uncharacterized protein LOC123546718 isoform X2 n=1 Tax=Mercenaria mercenaria TaxID=6596 RepID=UPI00234EF9D4|nr:uncharacterized protein LOC123546718 isoform X2 [Mercenaria mercenaria]
MSRATPLGTYALHFVVCVLIVGKSASSKAQCQLENGKCTYNINLNQGGTCSPPTKSLEDLYPKPEEFRMPADEKMNKMQEDFDVVKSDHENRIKELENSIQKVLRNAISPAPVQYSTNQLHVSTTSRRINTIDSRSPNKDGSGNILLLQLQNQFNTLRTSLSQRTADLLEARNKLNETTDLLKAAQKQSFESNSKLVSLETKSAVLERENRILKNKLKDKTERLEYATETLNTTETKLVSIENQLYDVVRSEATLKEELETVKHMLKETQTKLEELQKNHTELHVKYKKARRTLKIRNEELMECYTAKTQTFCGFEDPDLCGFTQENVTDDFDWERIQGRTPSANTGADNDHTCKDRNGHYMYIEASGKSKGQTAKMYTPKYRGLNPQCIEFFYHMHGRTTGTFTVYSKLLTSDEFRAVWRVFGNQGNLWIKAGISVDEETARSGYQLIFEAKTETGYEGDISMDDFRIRDGLCALDAASLEIKPEPLPQQERSYLLNEQIERYRKILRRRQRMRNERDRSSGQ